MTAVATRPRESRAAAPVPDAPLSGTGTLVRLALRRDRVRLPAWILGTTALMVAGAAAYPGLYPTSVERQAQAVIFDSTPAMKAMAGPGHGTDDYTYGAMLTNEFLAIICVLAALMAIFTVVRHTRAEEEDGRAELVLADVTGRLAPLASAVLVAVGASLALGALLAVGLGSLGIETVDWPGSLLFGAAVAATGVVFAGAAAMTSQLSRSARAASGAAGALVGAAYLVRAVGDVLDNGLSWVSPIGWAQATAAYVDDVWWPVGLAGAAGALLVWAAGRLAGRRDLGAGLRAERRGSVEASRLLGTPVGLAWRLQRSTVFWWAVAMAVFGSMYGSAMEVIEDYADNEFVAQMIESMGGATLTQSYLAMILALLSIVTSVLAVTAVLRPRREEAAGRAEPVLATAISRTGWYASHLAVAVAGSLLVLATTGLALGLTAAATSGDAAFVGDAFVSILAYAPAVWVTAAFAVLAAGWLPRATALAWGLVGYAFLMVYFGGLLDLPQWLVDLSPFSHVPASPAEELTATPLVVLTLVAAALTALGLLGFARRDLRTG